MDEWEHTVVLREKLGVFPRNGTSRDLRLTREQRHNSQAVDMAIAQWSEIFVSNGVLRVLFFDPRSFSVFSHDV
ncbi:hypothetical protein BGW80DRAFT_1365369 [Lactifluus volemus]|nr:hypothetical protein BGW80DRAFT_1365369 [Lactifluus volemus]